MAIELEGMNMRILEVDDGASELDCGLVVRLAREAKAKTLQAEQVSLQHEINKFEVALEQKRVELEVIQEEIMRREYNRKKGDSDGDKRSD